MANQNGFLLEVEELGMVALATVVLLPGLIWAAGARTTGGKIVRGGLVAGLLAGLMSIEITLDQTAEAVGQAVEG